MKKKFKIDPFRWLFYNSVKSITKFSFRLFYSKQTKVNIQHLHDVDRPCILVSNHPSTMMDPINVAKEINGIVFFLANASMFKHWFANWFFTTFYCIKVERPADVNGRKIQNTKTFELANDFLVRRNGVLYIAIEGGSKLERRLRPNKTGAARIAFAAENSKDFNLGLTVIPVGLTYSDPRHLQGEVIINVGDPIAIADYKSIWKNDNRQGVQKLTDDIESRLQSLLMHTDPTEEAVEVLSQQLETLDRNSKDLPFWETIQLSLKRLPILKQLFHQNPKGFATKQQQVQTYFEQLDQLKITDKTVLQANTGLDYLKLVLGFPLFLYGYINNFLAIGIPGFITKKMKLYPGYDPAVKTMSALLTVPFFYYLQSYLLAPYFPAPYWRWIYVASLIPIGLVAWYYMGLAQTVAQRRRFDQLEEKTKVALKEKRANVYGALKKQPS